MPSNPIQVLQKAIIQGLENVKAAGITVFDTHDQTALFERVIIASGSSNRQTKALAASVRDSVRDAGFSKPRMEGEENGEWIIVDCGAAVVHIMQPSIRLYYHLEELWGAKPVALKTGAAKKKSRRTASEKEAEPSTEKSAATKTAKKTTVKKTTTTAVKKTATQKTAAKAVAKKASKTENTPASKPKTKPEIKPENKPAAKKTSATKSSATKSTAKKTARKTPAASAKKTSP